MSGRRFASRSKFVSSFYCDMLRFMKSYTWPLRVLWFSCLTAFLLFVPTAIGQEPGRDLDDLAKRVSKQVAKAGITSIVVADFVSPDGTGAKEGHYLAEEFSQRLEHFKKDFVVIDREQLASALSSAQLSAKDLSEAVSLERIGNSLRADSVAAGCLESSSDGYSVKVTVRRVKDGSIIVSDDNSIRAPAYVNNMALLDPGAPGPKIAKAGTDGISTPTCVYCPPPPYTDKDRAEKVQGIVVLFVVVNVEGRASRVYVAKSFDDGLTGRALEAVRKWKFKPATDKEGKVVPVIVPIEVNFRLH